MRTDLQIVQLPSPLPNFGGLLGRGTIQTDPNFGTKIARLTDGSDTPNHGTLQTADSPDAGIWNADDTMIFVRTTGALSLLYQFDKYHMTSRYLNYQTFSKVCFSPKRANILYEMTGTKVSVLNFTFTGGSWTLTSTTPMFDFANILPPGFVVKWSSNFAVSEDESIITASFSTGPQDTGIYACLWQQGHGAGKGFRRLDTNLGVVTGDWGEIGKIRLVSPTTKIPFLIHNFGIMPPSKYANISVVGTSSLLFWNVGTLDIVDDNMSGHCAKGMLGVYAGGPGGGQVAFVPYNNPTSRKMIIPAANMPANQTPKQNYQGDQHFAFGHVDPLDNAIVWVSSQSQIYPFTSAWMNEVRGVRVSDGAVLRACHTFNSGLSKAFIIQYAIAVPSRLGGFVAFSSDIMQSLGTDKAGNFRGDVFVAKIVV